MFDRDDALQLLEYDAWANDRIEGALRALPRAPAEAVRIFAHLVRAQRLWLLRVRGQDAGAQEFWPGHGLEDAARERAQALADWRAWLRAAGPGEFARDVRFANSRGEACSDPLPIVLQHLGNHGTHHRAQVAHVLRAAGHAPPATDRTVWSRERDALLRPARHFVVVLHYPVPLERIEELVVEHREHLDRGFAAGILLASGPQIPRTGGILLARAARREDLDAFLAADPFAREKVAEFRVIEFDPTRRQPCIDGWHAGR